MKKFKDSVLESWTGPASDSEEGRIRNTERMIKSALSDSELFDDLTYEVFIQGSYANNTNVKTNSDIDINIMLKSTFYSEKCEGKNDSDYGFIDGTISYNEFKNRVLIALAKKFKSENVSQKNKSISIQTSSYRVEADCIPSFQYRNYKRINSLVSDNFKEGIKYFATDGTEVINYPKEHINNGIEKNKLTSKKYKRTVRLVKRLRNKMKEEGYYSNENITSFLIECLIWNIPNNFFLIDKSWNKTIDNIITYIKSSIKDESYKEWGEVSEFFYLFHQNRKWKVSDVDEFIMKLKNYMEY